MANACPDQSHIDSNVTRKHYNFNDPKDVSCCSFGVVSPQPMDSHTDVHTYSYMLSPMMTTLQTGHANVARLTDIHALISISHLIKHCQPVFMQAEAIS